MAHIDRDFPERIFPTEIELILKLGAKVMFIANDMHYNDGYADAA